MKSQLLFITLVFLSTSLAAFAQGTANNVALWTSASGLGTLGSNTLGLLPRSKFALNSYGTTATLEMQVSGFAKTLGPVLTLTNTDGYQGAAAALDFNSYMPSTNGKYFPAARIAAVDAGNSSDNILFQSNAPGQANNGAQTNMIIMSTGLVGIGTKFTSSSPGATLDVAGTVTAENNLTLMGDRTIIAGFDGVNNHWFGPTPDTDLAFGINRITANNYKFTVNGTTITRVLTITGGSDLAEPFRMSTSEIPQGAVVIIDEHRPGQLKLSEHAYDTRVAGVVSGANGIHPGISMHQDGVDESGQNVALSGRVYVLANAANGPIKPGDLLTTSTIPGYAMKVTDHGRARGSILGKAMAGLREGQGLVLMLITLQ